jgi:hypothetical protein
VDSPRALSGLSGTISAQFIAGAAGGAWVGAGVGVGRVRAAEAAASCTTDGADDAMYALRSCDDTGASTAASSPMTTANNTLSLISA